MSYDWTRFKKQVFIKAGREAVFDAWAKPALIVRWFIAEAHVSTAEQRTRDGHQAIEAGDRYFWRWHQELETVGKICRVVPSREIVFTFGRVDPDSPEVMVTVEVDGLDDGRTRLTLTQKNMPDTPAGHLYHLSCNLGWSFFMTNLKGWLEHGVDLRESDPELAAAARAISL